MQSKTRFLLISIMAVVAMVTCSWIIYDANHTDSYMATAPEIQVNLEPEINNTLVFSDRKKQVLMQLISEGLYQLHYSPMDLDDKFSEEMFDLYLKRIDLNKMFLHQEDVDQLKAHRQLLDDEIKAGQFALFEKSTVMIMKREQEVAALYEAILAQPFDFTKNETIEFDADKQNYPTTAEEVKDRWRKRLKYETMTMLASELDIQEKAIAEKDTAVTIKDMPTIEAEMREKVRKRYEEYFQRLAKLDETDRLATYVNAFTSRYGPHTEYFPPADKANFDIAMSGQLEGIGARLIDKEGYIKVSSLVPGGPASMQGDLEAEDKIMEVAQEGEEPVNIVGAKIDDAVKIIRGPKGSKVTLTVKKIDGSIKDITIIRDVVQIEETYAKSAVLEKDGKKVGIINLPKFYTDFQGTGARSSAEDVRKEIVKLKAEGVDGIIMDLRNNGGGSLKDAIDMAGLFIEEGPMVQVKQRGMRPEVLRDNDNGEILYDGSLVVLVNRFSASASEILAAAIQDYNRGVIMGSASSFGKGTVQQFVGLDRFLDESYDDVKPLGDLKVTLQKFYRVNGGATQLKGVVPDIVMPDNWAYIEVGEKDQEYVMPWDQIEEAKIKPFAPPYNLKKVIKSSESRIKSNAELSLIDENAHRLKKQRDITEYSIHLDTYRAEMKARADEADKYDEIRKKIDGLSIRATKSDQALIDNDEKLADRVKVWHENLEKDPYLEEALNVIGDMK